MTRLGFTRLLGHVVDHWDFIWADGRYRIVDSRNLPPSSLLVIASDHLTIRLVDDRGALMLQFQQTSKSGKAQWHLGALVQELQGEEALDESLPELGADFVQRRLTDIEAAFSEQSIEDTKQKLKVLGRARAKRLFGQ